MISEALNAAGVAIIEKYNVHRYFTDSCNNPRGVELVHYDSDGDLDYTTVPCKVCDIHVHVLYCREKYM